MKKSTSLILCLVAIGNCSKIVMVTCEFEAVAGGFKDKRLETNLIAVCPECTNHIFESDDYRKLLELQKADNQFKSFYNYNGTTSFTSGIFLYTINKNGKKKKTTNIDKIFGSGNGNIILYVGNNIWLEYDMRYPHEITNTPYGNLTCW